MDRTSAELFLRKHIKLRLHSGLFYSGYILTTSDDSLTFRDKFNKDYAFSYDAIAVIEELE